MHTTKDVAKLLGVSEAQVRGFVKAGFCEPQLGARGEWRFVFSDLVMLRTAKALLASKVPAQRVRLALKKLLAELPSGRPLSTVKIAAEGKKLVVHDAGTKYDPVDGQLLFDFNVGDLAKKVAPLAKKNARIAKAREAAMGSEDWYALACELEMTSIARARDAYRRAIALDPAHADAHNNLGRLLHEQGEFAAALAHYRQALAADNTHDTAWFNLGVALEDAGLKQEAVTAYEAAIVRDPDNADAHWNAARLYEALGRPMLALRHLRAHKKLNR